MKKNPNSQITDTEANAKSGLILAEKIDSKTKQKLKAQQHSTSNVWFGLGMMGLVGWSIALPTILGATLGIWLDKHYKVQHSWTLALIVAGLTIGCFTAWSWISKEDKAMHDDNEQGGGKNSD